MIGTDTIGTATERSQGLVGEQIVYAALDVINEALERSEAAPTKSLCRRELEQVRGTLSTLPNSGFELEGDLRHLIDLLRQPILEPRRRRSTVSPPPPSN